MTVTRRSLLIAGTSAPMAGALAGTAAAAPRAARPSAGRTLPLRDGWRFALVNPGGITDPTGEYADAAAPGHDDRGRPPPLRCIGFDLTDLLRTDGTTNWPQLPTPPRRSRSARCAAPGSGSR